MASWHPRPGLKPYDFDSNRASHSGSSALTVRACNALSAITGIPSPRRRPLLLGTYTRLTGRGDHGLAWCCIQSARSAFCDGVTTSRRSTPAVLRPALISVTRRTARALLRERSISFCKLRTLFRSPSRVAAKIRCRSRRTLSSWVRQSMASQPGGSPSGPFTPRAAIATAKAIAVIVSNLPFGSGAVVSTFLRRLTRPASAPFQARASALIRPVMR